MTDTIASAPSGDTPGALPARVDIDASSPYAAAFTVYAACDQAQLAALETTAGLFLSDTITHLNLLNPRPGTPYQHATFTETVRRFARAQGCTADWVTDGETDSDTGTGIGGAALGGGVDAPDDASESSSGLPGADDRFATDAPSVAGAPSDPDAPATSSPDDAAELGFDCAGEAGTGSTGQAGSDSEFGSTNDSAPDPQAKQPASPALPGFPRFSPDRTFNAWVHTYSHAEDIAELTAIRGTTIAHTYSHVIDAMTLIHGLPKFHARCQAGDFTIEHALAATRLCSNVAFRHLPLIDDYLCHRRPDVTIQTFKKSLALKINVIEPADDRTHTAHERRRVSLTTHDDGSACLMLTGSALELHACYLRIEAFAKAIRAGNTAAFADQLPADAVIEDVRSIDALMFDILTSTTPRLTLTIRAHDTDTGATADRSIPLDLDTSATMDDIATAITTAADTAGPPHHEARPADAGPTDDTTAEAVTADAVAADAETAPTDDAETGSSHSDESAAASAPTIPAIAGNDDSESKDEESPPPPPRSPGAALRAVLTRIADAGLDDQGRSQYSLTLEAPTSPYWMAMQARMLITVPCTTLTGHSNLPGTLPDGTPLPADQARLIAGSCRTWTRILTDPATGTPIDAKAKTYHIPTPVRTTLAAQWQWCTVPGCRRRAATAEIDHIDPFNHDNPDFGGLTVFGNLHPLCKQHHQQKTDRLLTVRMRTPGIAEYTFAHGTRVTTHPGDNPVNVENARLINARTVSGTDDDSDENSPAPVSVSSTDDSDPGSRAPDADEPFTSSPRTSSPSTSNPDDDLDAPGIPPLVAEPPDSTPAPGPVRTGPECPGPACGETGTPGWMPRAGGIRWKNPAQQEWVWDNGEPPPF
ncbi:HNH endonuclease signature motif containing protein [Brevibacterium sp. 2SA]|uniref:HNH endonuclease signature motif containing protein n=1 Tax=Brevibacterium sp. 2SA TaxID=2502198 RepID=UPI0010F6FBFD|nr:HNH endonuclease signature motif containing protein [Brevibacterium sp. 2SA]